jgi:hypothetical protein
MPENHGFPKDVVHRVVRLCFVYILPSFFDVELSLSFLFRLLVLYDCSVVLFMFAFSDCLLLLALWINLSLGPLSS